MPARQLAALPASLPVELGSHAEPLSVGRQTVKLAQVGPGDPVLVYGVGPIGLYAIIALKLAGAGPVVAAGRSAEVANVVTWLLSPESEYVSGALHLIDGALNS